MPEDTQDTPQLPHKEGRKKIGRRFRKKNNPGQAKPSKPSSRRDFLTLLFPKQKSEDTSKGKRKGLGKRKLALRQKRLPKQLIASQASKNVSTEKKQPEIFENGLKLLSQETPLLQAPSRRKFIKMAGMTAAAAALWREAVACGGYSNGMSMSLSGYSGYLSEGSYGGWQSSGFAPNQFNSQQMTTSASMPSTVGSATDWEIMQAKVPSEYVEFYGSNLQGFYAVYKGGACASGGHIVIYQGISLVNTLGGANDRAPHMDGQKEVAAMPICKLPYGMQPTHKKPGYPYGYMDSPTAPKDAKGAGLWRGKWRITAAAVCRKGCDDTLLSCCYFEFDNQTRKISGVNAGHTAHLDSCLADWKTLGGARNSV